MPGKNLTRDEARERADLLSVATYDVALDLTTGPKNFRTTTTVRFDATTEGASTFIDLIADSVQAITLNGESLDPATHFDGVRVQLPSLRASNELTIDATGVYMNTGEGLHRFVDPVDDEVYLYTQFEVADCRRMFAVFEQPDLKATFAFTVTAPARWQIVSNETTPEPTPAGEADGVPSATWTFAATPRISCYITALIAGPYDVVRDEVQTRGGTVPLGIFCRKSLTAHLDADNIFDCTKRGFAFFENEFDQPYPFTKYDQIFTPEYNMGAMENAGAVTFTEVYVFRAKVAEAVIERRALTILHELAHMWFGNLVTMQLVERPVAQRVLRRVGVHHGAGRGHRVDHRVDDVRHLREGVGLPPGPALLDAPDRGRHPRPGRRRGQLRRHHLRQGRVRTQAARGLRRS